MCEDVDECVDESGQEVCINGICINTFGSYECECASGSTLDNTGRMCVGRYLYNRYTYRIRTEIYYIIYNFDR